MKKVLVTGAAGFMGSHVVNKLIDRYNVVAIDDLSGGFTRNLNPKASFYQVSINDIEFLEKLFAEHKFDYVFHLAAYAAEGLSHFVRLFNYKTNLMGSVNLINESVKNGVKCFCFTSSMAVYGTNRTPMTEDLTPMPEDPYGIAKLSVEKDLMAAHEMFGLDYVVFRPHNVYGQLQNMTDKHRNVIAIFMNQILSGKPMTIFGSGNQRRSFTYIDDISEIIANGPENKSLYNQVFNIGSEREYSLNELAEAIKKVAGRGEIQHIEERYEVKDAFCSSAKIKSYLGDLQDTPLEEGIRKMWEWAETQEISEPKLFNDIEITKNMLNVWKKN